jgi:hypothetical protein
VAGGSAGTGGGAGRGGSGGTAGGSAGATAGAGGGAGAGGAAGASAGRGGGGGSAGAAAGSGGAAGSAGAAGGGGAVAGASGSGGAPATTTHSYCVIIGGAGDRATITQREPSGPCLRFMFDNIAPTQTAGLTLPQGWGNGRGAAYASADCTGNPITPVMVTGTVASARPDAGAILNIIDVDLVFTWSSGSIPSQSTIRVDDLQMGCQ